MAISLALFGWIVVTAVTTVLLVASNKNKKPHFDFEPSEELKVVIDNGDRSKIPYKDAMMWWEIFFVVVGALLSVWFLLQARPPAALLGIHSAFVLFMASGIRFVVNPGYGIELKGGRLTSWVFGPGFHWVFPFVTKVDQVSTQEQVKDVSSLTVTLGDGLTVMIGSYMRWNPTWRIARWVGGVLENVFWKKRKEAVETGLTEAQKKEVSAVLGQIDAMQFVKQRVDLLAMVECIFQVAEEQIFHYDDEDDGFIASEGVWKPIPKNVDDWSAGIDGWRKTAGWNLGDIPLTYRLDFYGRNRKRIVARSKDARLDTGSASRYEELNGADLEEYGFDAQLTEETRAILRTTAAGDKILALADKIATRDPNAVAFAGAVQGVTPYQTNYIPGLGQGGSLTLVNAGGGK